MVLTAISNIRGLENPLVFKTMFFRNLMDSVGIILTIVISIAIFGISSSTGTPLLASTVYTVIIN